MIAALRLVGGNKRVSSVRSSLPGNVMSLKYSYPYRIRGDSCVLVLGDVVRWSLNVENAEYEYRDGGVDVAAGEVCNQNEP